MYDSGGLFGVLILLFNGICGWDGLMRYNVNHDAFHESLPAEALNECGAPVTNDGEASTCRCRLCFAPNPMLSCLATTT